MKNKTEIQIYILLYYLVSLTCLTVLTLRYDNDNRILIGIFANNLILLTLMLKINNEK